MRFWVASFYFIYFLPFFKGSLPAKCWAMQQKTAMTKRHAENMQNNIKNLTLENLLTLLPLTHTCTHTLILKFYIWYNYWILCVYLHCWVSSSSSSWQRWCNKMSVYKKKTKKKLKKESDNTIRNANYHFYFLKPSSSYGIRNMKVTMILLLWWLLAFLSLTIYQSFDIMLCCYVKPNRTLCVHVNI